MGSLKVACSLAARYRVSGEKAALAALLHDAAKGLSNREMIRYAQRRKLRIPRAQQLIRHDPSLLHGYIGADIAARAFGITDPSILAAITHHTLGARHMDKLGKIIYIADATSPDRRYPAVKRLRAVSRRDLDAAFIMAMAHKLHYVVVQGHWIAPAAVQAWNAHIGAPRP
jgi:predicted HD superfamily hydrolase involved in NAD metabolism